MTSAAQVSANRCNAQKSTGPRTAEGKAVAAQNAVRHGLLAQEVVVKGEDPSEFELYREQMRAELAPASPVEEMLAQRIVHLSWRLRRAERLQAAAFDKVESQTEPSSSELSPEDAGKMLAFMVEQNIRPGPPPGRRVVQDFNQERVLDRLLVYERRLEHSLYRTMAELRLLGKDGVSSGRCQLARSSTDIPVEGLRADLPVTAEDMQGQACPEFAEGNGCGIHGQDARDTHGRDAHATEPEGGTPNEDGDKSCETNPMCPGVSSAKSEVASVLPTCSFPLETPEAPPEGGAPSESRQTNPIGTGAPDGPVPNGVEDPSDLAPGEIRRTKPIQGPGSTASTIPSRPRRIRKFPNTVNEETYDSYLGRWVWTGYAYANKDSDPADSGRSQ